MFSFGKLDMWPGFAVLAVAVFCYAVANADETAMQGYMHLRPDFPRSRRAQSDYFHWLSDCL